MSYFTWCWPKSKDFASKEVAENFARLSIVAGGEFPVALETIFAWLQPVEFPHYVVTQLHESKLSNRFPEEVLRRLDAIIGSQPSPPEELKECLKNIADSKPILKQNARFKRLSDYSGSRE